jgi:SHS2 domain-containing protein
LKKAIGGPGGTCAHARAHASTAIRSSAMAGRDYEFLEHTADLGIRVFGRDVAELFRNAARALADLHTDVAAVETRERRRVEARGVDPPDLLRHWLTELHYLYETERLLLPEAAIVELTDERVVAECRGERFDPARHEARGEIKAVTAHGLEIWEEADGSLVAEVIFDL